MIRKSKIILISRKSPLALAQAHLATEALKKTFEGLAVELHPVSTHADRNPEYSLSKSETQGIFTRELEELLLGKKADLAVHSLKDMPTKAPEGLAIAACLPRASAQDVLVLRDGFESPACIATSSPRRTEQLKQIFPKAQFCPIRGNVGTRLKKIAEGISGAEATVLASAGLQRLKIKEFSRLSFRAMATDVLVPAAGQGAIALQARLEDCDFFAPLNDEKTWAAVQLERTLLEALGGGCHRSIGIHCDGNSLGVFDENGKRHHFKLPKPEHQTQEWMAGICALCKKQI